MIRKNFQKKSLKRWENKPKIKYKSRLKFKKKLKKKLTKKKIGDSKKKYDIVGPK